MQAEETAGGAGQVLRAPEARSRAAAVLYAFGSGLLPAIGRYALGGTGSSTGLGWHLWSWLLLCQVLLGAQGTGLSDQGEGGALNQVLVQQPLALAV